jgi:hypothetical protein
MLLIPSLFAAALSAAHPVPAASGPPTAGASDDAAATVVAQMRQALGGAPRLDAVRALSLEADLRRVVPADPAGGEAQDLSGDLAIDASFPDRYLRVEDLPPFPGGPSVGIGTGLDGASAWRAPMGAPTGPNLVIRVAPPRLGPGGADGLRRHTQAELTRLQLLCLGAAPGLAFRSLGQAEAPEGRADVLEVTGADGFAARLFVDAASHKPLFLAYRAVVPRMHVVRMQAPPAEKAEKASREGAAGEPHLPAPPPAQEAEARMFVSAFKTVDGVALPFTVSLQISGGPTEEWQIRKWKLNPELKPERFKKS